MTPFAWSAALVVLGSDLTTPIPQKLECPAPLVWRGQQMLLDLHPVSGAGIDAERFQAALRQPCPAVAKPLRPFRGLREELRAADAVVVLRVEGFAFVDRPPGFGLGEMPSPLQEIDATVKKVLAGFIARPGAKIRLRLDAAQHQRWIQKHWGPPEFASGVRPGEDVTALVKRHGDRLEILNLLKAAEDERTDALFTEYARLAALDDDAFAAGLARLIADVVRGSPDRLLWVRWTVLAMDDWARLPAPPVGDRRFRITVTRTLDAVVAQLRSFPPRPDEFGPNLHDLPWLIRLLTEDQRRTLAGALLRLHPIVKRELATAEAQAAAESHPRGPLDELTATDIFNMYAGAGMSALMECLSLCLDPRDGRWRPGDDTLERVTAFIGKAPD